MTRWILAGACAATLACGGGNQPGKPPAPITGGPAQVDSLWNQANRAFRQGHWQKAATELERLVFEFPPGDPRIVRTHFLMGECYLASGDHLEAAREFRIVSDRTPNDALAPEGLMRAGDAFAELWKRPELDPSYGQTALATWQEILSRYPDAAVVPRVRERIARLQEQFAAKDFKNGMFYFRLKAYDSAIIYFSELLRNYPGTSVAPDAAVKLIETYRALGYIEEQNEKCAYARQNFPGHAEIEQVCPRPPPASAP